jgi:polyhydroxyalkanoate synthesis regulator phasin
MNVKVCVDNKFRGDKDLEWIIESQQNNILILEKQLEESKEEIDRLKKQITLLQNSIRTWTRKSTQKEN